MKKIWFGIMMTVVLLCIPGLVSCTSSGYSGVAGILSSQQEGIWVNGTGKVSVAPDVVNLSLGVESQANTVAEAQEKAQQAMNAVMQVLKSFNIADKDIKTQQYNISPIYTYDEPNRKSIITGYQVTNTVNVKIRDTGKAGQIIDDATRAAGDLIRINSVTFSIDDPTVYYAEARTKAMQDANQKAKQLAELGGVTLGKPTYISEYSSVPGPVYATKEMVSAAPDISTPISTGEMDITLNVQVTYSILK